MKREWEVKTEGCVLTLGADLVYAQKPYWCGGGFYPLKMSLIRPRAFFPYDPPPAPRPAILFIGGGGWTEADCNIWLPELVYFARQGYVVASVSYSLSPTWIFPEPLLDVKCALAYLRTHAVELGVDPERVALMGESAGGHLAALLGLGAQSRQFGPYPPVQAVVALYPPTEMADFEGRGELASYAARPQTLLRGEAEPQSLLAGLTHVRDDPMRCRDMDPCAYITGNAPPFLLLHGTADTLVPPFHSERLYERLTQAGAEAELLLIKGAEHADRHFVTAAVKARILAFLDKRLK